MAEAPGETVVEETGAGRFQVEAKTGGISILVDEPVDVGGLGSGPNPYDLLSAALGSCTAMTIRLYANQKNWPLKHVRVSVTHGRDSLHARDIFTKTIVLEGPLDEAQRTRLREIAERCPVHLTLHRGSDVTTELAPADHPMTDAPKVDCEHMKDMEEACAK